MSNAQRYSEKNPSVRQKIAKVLGFGRKPSLALSSDSPTIINGSRIILNALKAAKARQNLKQALRTCLKSFKN